MPNWKGIVGLSFSPAEFEAYCHSLHWTAWRPSFIVLHNTAAPSLAQRPKGFSSQNMKDLEAFYRGKGWKAGPHLFIDDSRIWVFTALTTAGTHSPSWNMTALGVEMLGDYAAEAFTTGRGAKVRANAVSAVATLSGVLGIDPATMRLHKEDPKTTHACPGAKVDKQAFIRDVAALVDARHEGEHAA
jgi:hypothetical protein